METVRKQTFCIWENIGADQLPRNYKADLRLSFCYMNSEFSLFLNLKVVLTCSHNLFFKQKDKKFCNDFTAEKNTLCLFYLHVFIMYRE